MRNWSNSCSRTQPPRRFNSSRTGLYGSDSFTLQNNGVEIQIVKVVNGNCGIRKVRRTALPGVAPRIFSCGFATGGLNVDALLKPWRRTL
jgi:hypothetical protein